MKKQQEKKKVFQLTKHFFFFFFGPFLLSNIITFLFFIHLKLFKVLQECCVKFYKSSLNSNNNRETCKEVFERKETNLCNVWWFVFFEFLTPFTTLEDQNFLISNLFSTIVSVSDAPTGEAPVLFGHQKQRSPPLGSSLPCCLVTSPSTLKHPRKRGF